MYFPVLEWIRRQYEFIRYDCLYIPPGAKRIRVIVWLAVEFAFAIPLAVICAAVLQPYPIAAMSVSGVLMIAAWYWVTHKNPDAEKERKLKERSEAWWRGETAWYKLVSFGRRNEGD